MKTVAFFLIMLMACATHAQLTAPRSVDLRYHFEPSQNLHWHRHLETRTPGNDPGYPNNYDINEDIFATVELVDANGNATLKIANDESVDMKGGSKTEAGIHTAVSLGMDIPVYEVTIDPRGNFLNGRILRRSPQDSLALENSKNPKIITFRSPDSNLIKRQISYLLPVRSSKTELHIDSKWHDSIFTPSHAAHFDLSHSASGQVQPPPPSWNAKSYDYEIRAVDPAGTMFKLLTIEHTHQSLGGSEFHNESLETELCRASDGLILERTQSWGKPTDQHTTQTWKLVE